MQLISWQVINIIFSGKCSLPSIFLHSLDPAAGAREGGHPCAGRAPVPHLKRQFGHAKVHYWGLAKNTAQLHALFALVNLWLVRRKLLATLHECLCSWPKDQVGCRSAAACYELSRIGLRRPCTEGICTLMRAVCRPSLAMTENLNISWFIFENQFRPRNP